MKRFTLGLAAIVLAVSAGLALGANPIQRFTGPSGTNPVIFPAALSDLNSLVNEINANIGTYLNLNNSSTEAGYMAFSSSTSFVAPTNCLATGTGKHCLVIVDSAGTLGYIPVE